MMFVEFMSVILSAYQLRLDGPASELLFTTSSASRSHWLNAARGLQLTTLCLISSWILARGLLLPDILSERVLSIIVDCRVHEVDLERTLRKIVVDPPGCPCRYFSASQAPMPRTGPHHINTSWRKWHLNAYPLGR